MKYIVICIAFSIAALIQSAQAQADFCWHGRSCSGAYTCLVDVPGATAPAPDGTPAPTGEQTLGCGTACDLWAASGGNGCLQATQWIFWSGRWHFCAKAAIANPGCCSTPCDPQSDPAHCEIV